MSHDGSSAKSYIRHATEKERLDNLAFASFPEDYLPYAAPGHHRGSSAPPPYLLWGDDGRRRRPAKRRRKPRCAGALLCAIALVVVAILAVVAISVYLGVVTNLFRSPVVSVSGRFTSPEEFSEELLNSTSPQFLEKADIYQSKVEKAFLSSTLEPAFIAARIYSFRPGLVVFFRVYLDRRKLVRGDGASPPTDLVKALVSQKLTQDPNSVHVEENEELLPEDLRTTEKTLVVTGLKTTAMPPSRLRPAPSGGVGEWRPVPIEDSVKPSFAGPPPGNIGSGRSPEEFTRRNPVENIAPVRVVEEPPLKRNNLPVAENPSEGVGSVRVSEETRLRNPLLPATRREGTGSVRLLEDTLSNVPPLVGGLQEGVGSVRILEDSTQKVPKLPEAEGIGTVRLIDETPKKSAQLPIVPRPGLVRLLEENPSRKPPTYRFPTDRLGGMEQPPTLAPSVSLVVRNRSRTDRPRNPAARLEKSQENPNLYKNQNIGVGSIREIITEVDSFPVLPAGDPGVVASKLLGMSLDKTTTSKLEDELVTVVITEKESRHLNVTLSQESTTEVIPVGVKVEELVLRSHAEDLTSSDANLSKNENVIETETTTLTDRATSVKVVATEPTSSLQGVISNRTQKPFETTVHLNTDFIDKLAISVENISDNISSRTDTTENYFALNSDTTTSFTSTDKQVSLSTESTTPEREVSEADDIHSSIVNHSQYPNPEPHYHTLTNEHNISKITYDAHTLKGHGFHRPLNSSETVTIATFFHTSTTDVPISAESENRNSGHGETSVETSVILSVQNNSEIQTVEDLNLSHDDTDVASNASVGYSDIWPSEEDQVGNITTEDNSQQAKVVPQLQSELLSNDIGDAEDEPGDEENRDRFEDEILRHITTLRPQQNGSSVQSCPPGLMACSVSREGCGMRCDMRKDCPDNEDEHGCTCSELLRAMGQSQKICDGVDDCSDGSDESDCTWCPSAEYFRCPGSRTCIPMDRVCDGKEDCPAAQDEKRCVSLADSSGEAESPEYRSRGYLVVRRSGQWGKLCLDTLIQSPDLERRTKELGHAVCTALTYRNLTSSVRTRDQNALEDSYFRISTDSVNSKSASSLFEQSSCAGKEVLRVHCESLECGLRPSAPPSQRRRIVGGRSAEGSGTWPWAAALYREGDFQCGAALISDQWLVSAAHCFYSSLGAYWVARLGMLRRGSELRSRGEQVRRISDIVLHPLYEDVGFINDIALLRMESVVPFSDSLRPICQPSSPEEDASLWHGRRCSVVGWGKLYEIGHTFPDSLQEVRLPVISSAECQRKSLFLPAYRITPNMFCAGYERGGRDACLGDSGGPMACQRPADGRWVLLGVTSNGDGCGRPNRPGVYTQVAGYLAWINEILSKQQNDFDGRTGSESVCAGSIRCHLGRCIAQSRICDGRRDCAGGEDESDC